MPPQETWWIHALRPRRRSVFWETSRQLKGLRYLGAIGLLAVGYWLLVQLVFKFPLPDNLRVYPIWPPAAYSQLILFLMGLKFWPAVALGTLLNNHFSGVKDSLISLLSALNNTVQALLSSWLLLRTNFSHRFDHLRDVGLLVICAGFIPAAVSATLGILICCLQDPNIAKEFITAWFDWWMGNFSGVLILFPVILTLPEWSHQFRTLNRKFLGVLWIAGLSLLSWFVFAAPVRADIAPFPLEYLPFPFIVWGAFGLGVPGAAIAIMVTTSFAGWGFIQNVGPFFDFSERPEQAVLALQAYICVLIITALALAATTAERAKAKQELEIEKEKSEQLLLNILPHPIAIRLKRQEGTIADHFAEATVLFADIVNFTQLSTELSPQMLVILLNEIFSTFDVLAEKHGLEKIKTIGDAYMVVGGLPEHRQDHAIAMAEMAFDMQRAIVAFSQKHDRPFTMRIGINTGPVIAGVIGQKKFIYDLWGDTVNIASRMESAGIAGEIQVTQDTYETLKEHYAFDCRGEISIKGKGLMMAYLMRERVASAIVPTG